MSLNDSANYNVILSEPFERSYKELKRTHYRKNEKGVGLLEQLIADFVGIAGYDPRPPIEIARNYNAAIKDICQQQYNSAEYAAGFDFRKLYFACPTLKGKAGMGRLMYLIDDKDSDVHLLYIYTHQIWPKRPPDSVMNDVFRQFGQRARE